MNVKIEAVPINFPENCNVILGMSHFIKTVEDLHELMVNCRAETKFGLAFSEASGPRLIRKSGTDEELVNVAVENIQRIGCGHSFMIVFRDSFPINYLPRLKDVPEIVNIMCATANPAVAIVARTDQGGALLGVVDGMFPLGVESEEDRMCRHQFLRRIGYKL